MKVISNPQRYLKTSKDPHGNNTARLGHFIIDPIKNESRHQRAPAIIV